MNWLNGILSLLLIAVALWSMRGYTRRLEKALVLCSALCVLAILWQENWIPWLQAQLPPKSPSTLVIHSDKQAVLTPSLQRQIEGAQQIQLLGDGYRRSQWQDIKARPLVWQQDKDKPSLQLQFKPQVALGREFELVIQRQMHSRPVVDQRRGQWHAQLLAENGVVLAEEKSKEASLRLRWLAPVAERMVLQAKVFDENERLIDAGPIPVEVKALKPLQVWGRFDASSFDARSLQNVLRQSQALLDWQTRLGKDIQHIETPVTEITNTDLMLIDAAFLEQQSGASLQQILAQVAKGKTLMVLGANANQTNFWRQRFELNLQASNLTKDAEVTVDVAGFGSMSLTPNAFSVMPNNVSNAGKASTWHAYPQSKGSTPWLWQRSWQGGGIAWIALSDWHRHAIATPQKLTAWWQQIFDQLESAGPNSLGISLRDEMPLLGERQIVCAQGIVQGGISAVEKVVLPLSSYAEAVDQLCTAWRPMQIGWQELSLTAPELKSPMQQGFYVYANDAWPTWQRYLKAQANLEFAERLPARLKAVAPQLPMWPLYLLTALLLLGLWRIDTKRA